VPANDLVRVLEILAMRLGSNRNRDFFAVKVLLRVVRHIFAHMAPRKCKVGTEETSPRTFLDIFPIGNDLGQEEDAALGSKHVRCHSPGLIDTSFGIA
jgi:hypothetical protein